MRTIEVPLFYRSRVVCWVKVDARDEDSLMEFAPWRIDFQRGTRKSRVKHPHPYARRDFRLAGDKYTLYMHRYLLVGFERTPGMVVDHKNGDTLDNRRSNLRLVTEATNRLNRRDRAACECELADLYVSQ